HSSKPGFTVPMAQEAMQRTVASGETKEWWYGGGRLFQIFLQPIYFGAADEDLPLGLVALGYEIDERVAVDISRVAASQVAFRYGPNLVVSTVSTQQQAELIRSIGGMKVASDKPQPIDLAGERFLSSSVSLAMGASDGVTLTVLRSYDEATAFLRSLN